MSPRWRKVLRDLVSHKFRTFLVVMSIAVGVFAVAVVLGGRGVLVREFDTSYEQSNAPIALYDTSDFDESVVREVLEAPGVQDAEGRRHLSLRYTRDPDPQRESAAYSEISIVGLADFNRERVKRITRGEGSSWPPGTGEIVLEQSAHQVGDWEVGDTITVETSQGEHVPLRVVGFVHDINAFPAMFVGSVSGFVSMDVLPTLDEPDAFNHLDVVFDGGASLSRTHASELAAGLRDDVLERTGTQVYFVRVPTPGSHFLGDIFKAVSLLLLALGVLSLALSGFLVVNTVSALMAQQVRQVGIMKAIGGRRDQVAGMYLVMVMFYGVLAVGIAVPAGVIAGGWFIDFAAGLLNFRIDSYIPPLYVLALEVVVGMIVPIAAAAIPVRAGSMMPVARALNTTGMASARFGHGLLDRALGLVRGLPRPIALSLRNTFLRKGRLILTLTTLTLASAVVMGVLSVRASILQTVEDISSWWNYDVEASFARPQASDAIERAASKTPEVVDVETWLERPVSYERPDGTENQEIFAIGLPPDSEFIVPRVVSGRWLEPGDTNAIVVNTDVAKQEPELTPGHRVRLTIYGAEEEWEVVGAVSGQLMGAVIFVPRDRLDEVTNAGGTVTTLMAKTRYHSAYAQDRVSRALETDLEDAGLPPTGSETQRGLMANIANELGILVAFLVIMASLLALVGVIGLTGTMTINVLESTREIGVMRSIGATHGALYGIFITEGVVIGLMSWGLGAVLSYPMSQGLVRLLSSAMNLPLSYKFSWPGVGAWLLGVVVIAVIGSLTPAYRASRISVRDAISYE